ncbi:MAG: PrgI family protein [Patescibacteria group bacterium]
MRFQVPQFIEVEDKIIGPLTIKQFIYIAGGAGMCFVLIRYLGLLFGIMAALPVGAFALALAFYHPNERQTFILFVENVFKYFVGKKLYIWKKQDKKPVARTTEEREASSDLDNLYVPRLADSKLKDMTWSLDVKTKELANPVTKNNKQV